MVHPVGWIKVPGGPKMIKSWCFPERKKGKNEEGKAGRQKTV